MEGKFHWLNYLHSGHNGSRDKISQDPSSPLGLWWVEVGNTGLHSASCHKRPISSTRSQVEGTLCTMLVLPPKASRAPCSALDIQRCIQQGLCPLGCSSVKCLPSYFKGPMFGAKWAVKNKAHFWSWFVAWDIVSNCNSCYQMYLILCFKRTRCNTAISRQPVCGRARVIKALINHSPPTTSIFSQAWETVSNCMP